MIEAIDEYYYANQQQRRHLGLSQIGHKCKRFLWYKHRGHDEKKTDGRTLRLFELGNIIEAQIVFDLAMIGIAVIKRQYQVSFTFNDITLTGSIDGIVNIDVPMLWECKTMNEKNFAKLKKEGYEKYSEQYKTQLHAYMLGIKLKKALVTVYNKNNSELYDEVICIDEEWIIDKLTDVFKTISMDSLPAGICTDEKYFEANSCPFKEACFK